MSFSGKKFRRIGSENIEELLNVSANENPHLTGILNCQAPIFSFTRTDEDTFIFAVEHEDYYRSHSFKLGEELDVQGSNGKKMIMTYTLEGDDVLLQVIKQSDGKITHFRRDFSNKQAKLNVRVEGSPVEAKIFYEVVNDY